MAFALSLIGFGEAAQAFAAGADWIGAGYDIADRTAELEHHGIDAARTPRGAVHRAAAVLNLVTPGASLDAAKAAAAHLAAGALWLDLTSVAPATKRAAAAVISAAGGRYVDAAIMAPVHPRRREVPILLAGPYADAGHAALAAAGFGTLRIVAGPVGTAAAIKMIRSVMVKGIEALTAECCIAADRAGVLDEVLGSLGADWAGKANYNLERMLVHGGRRADELGEVAATLADLGVDPAMTRAAAGWHRQLGAGTAPDGLAAKLALITPDREAETA